MKFVSLYTVCKGYIKAHLDHFLISLGVSIVITLITNVFLLHLAFWLHLCHVPEFIIRWMGYR